MNGRRGFLAFVGGTAFTGAIGTEAVARPTLLLPPELVPTAAMPPWPLLKAAYGRDRSQLHSFIDIKSGLPDDRFNDWLEQGLRMVRGCQPPALAGEGWA